MWCSGQQVRPCAFVNYQTHSRRALRCNIVRTSWKFVKLQRRRSQTEGRISIIIHNFLGCPIRSKGFAHRQLAVGWGVLTHNLWVVARLPKHQAKKKAAPLRKAA